MSSCKGCGKEILWGVTSEGKKIPLDPKPPVYVVSKNTDGSILAERFKGAYVNHFITCPDREQFSSSKKV